MPPSAITDFGEDGDQEFLEELSGGKEGGGSGALAFLFCLIFFCSVSERIDGCLQDTRPLRSSTLMPCGLSRRTHSGEAEYSVLH